MLSRKKPKNPGLSINLTQMTQNTSNQVNAGDLPALDSPLLYKIDDVISSCSNIENFIRKTKKKSRKQAIQRTQKTQKRKYPQLNCVSKPKDKEKKYLNNEERPKLYTFDSIKSDTMSRQLIQSKREFGERYSSRKTTLPPLSTKSIETSQSPNLRCLEKLIDSQYFAQLPEAELQKLITLNKLEANSPRKSIRKLNTNS